VEPILSGDGGRLLPMRRRDERRDGRIPFRIRIGVTGHRDLRQDEVLGRAVREQIRRLYDLFDSAHTDTRLSVVSQLADGADRLVVLQVMAEAAERDHQARSEAILPFARDEYVAVQGFSVPSREEFDRLLGEATAQSVASSELSGEEGAPQISPYEAAGHQLVERCDVLIALWDGKPSGGRGGTAETLLYAAARSKPCIWISTEDEAEPRSNLGHEQAAPFYRAVAARAQGHYMASPDQIEYPEDVIDPLWRSLDELDAFNSQKAPVEFESRLGAELASGSEVDDWVAAPFVRATTLAARWHSRFAWATRSITLSATLAAAMLAASLSYGREIEGWSVAEACFLFFALAGIRVVRKVGFHRRWLSYRVLAEWLRTAHFLTGTGADLRRQAKLEGVYIDGEATGWLIRAFEEVWDGRPRTSADLPSLDRGSFDDIKQTLANDWIGRQISYHAKASKRHHRAHLMLLASTLALFAGAIVFAVLHTRHILENTAIFFSITLPAAGASLGVLLSVNQHEALSARYKQMRSDLRVAKVNILDATPQTLVKASSEAAHAVAQETGGWFSSMWFLDIEHP